MASSTDLIDMLQFIFLFSLCLLANCQGQQTHYITPDHDTTSCTELPTPCLTLNDYISQNATEKFPSDTTIVFLPGIHYLSVTTRIIIQDVRNLVLRGDKSPVTSSGESELFSQIICTNSSGFFFFRSTDIEIANLTLSHCGGTFSKENVFDMSEIQNRSSLRLTEYKHTAVLALNVYSLHLSHTVIQNSTGLALVAINVLGNSTIASSSFLFNNYYTLEASSCQNLSPEDPRTDLLHCIGGGALFVYTDLPKCPSAPQLHGLQITSSLFAYGVNLVPAVFVAGSGLTVILTQSSYGVEVLVKDSMFSGNFGRIGANMAFRVFDHVDNTSVTVEGCYSGESNSHFTPIVRDIFNDDYTGGGLFYGSGYPLPSRFTPTCQGRHLKHRSDVLKVYNTNFVNNSGVCGAGIKIRLLNTEPPESPFIIDITNCSFVDNHGSPGSALAITQTELIELSLVSQIIIKNCTFSRNSYPFTFLPNIIQHFEQDLINTVFLVLLQDVTVGECRFEDNVGTPIYAYGSRLRFFGNVTFEHNSGLNGGGLSLSGDSLMLLSPNTRVYLLENSAWNNGGGIFVPGTNLHTRLSCFFQIDLRNLSSIGILVPDYFPDGSMTRINVPRALNMEVVLENNTADEAGTAIYGGRVDDCDVISTSQIPAYRNSGELFDQLFRCNNATCNNSGSDQSLISSTPFQVCFCDPTTITSSCSLTRPHIAIYPGQTFNVLVSSIAQREGISSGVVFADFLLDISQEQPMLGDFQRAQEVGKECTRLTYTIYSGSDTLNMILALEDSVIVDTTTYLIVDLLPCPPGFVLSPSPSSCQCNSFLQSFGITCDINTQTVRRSSEQWLSVDLYDDSSDDTMELLLHEFCPFDYCISEEIDLNLLLPDTQCALNRSGILCGGCQAGLSVALGGSHCLSCSNSYLALLIPFAVAGLCLVFLLFACNTLTVATGILNGLIFYANIVQYNRGIFFPPGKGNILTVFISWLNLDLGISTCFYDGMDTYSKTWLQFIFPVYIWIILIFKIFLSRRSATVAKLAGEQAVPVLATLLLLSFAKIIRTIITSLSYTRVLHSDGEITTMWLFDANIEYLTGKHIPLFLFSIFTLILLVIPFAFVLTFSPLLLTLSSHRLFKWVNRLKPFFDAYQGPYKDKHRHWTGVLLFVRGFLFLIYAFNATRRPGVILMVTIFASLLLVAYGWISGGVYKQWPVNVLELLFFLNLGFLASASLYVRHAGGSQAAVIYTSVTIALLEFMGMVVYSFLHRLSAHFDLRLIFIELMERVLSPHRGKSQPAEITTEVIVMETFLPDVLDPVSEELDGGRRMARGTWIRTQSSSANLRESLLEC